MTDGPTPPPPTGPPSSPPPPAPPGFQEQPGESSGDGNSGKPWWQRWWAIAIAAFFAVGIVGAAFGLGSDDGDEQSSTTELGVIESTDQPAATDAPPETDDLVEPDPPETASAPTTAPSATTTTTTTLPPMGQDPSAPLPMGDPVLSGFTYEESFSKATWEGRLLGLVETGNGRFNDDPGRCVVLIGAITPTETDGAVSSGFNTPNFSLIAGGRLVDSSVNDCDTEGIEAAGYGWILDAEVTVGTTYPFYSEFFLEGPDAETTLDAVVAGNPSGGDALYFEATVIPGIPQPDTASQESGRDLTPMGDPAISGFMYGESFSDAAWKGLPLGLIETGTAQFNDETGRCLVLVGEISPTSAEGAISSGFSTPSFGLITNGQLIDSGVNDCDTDALESAGYGWILDAEVTIGTPYPFFAEFFIEGADPSTPIEAMVVGNASEAEALYYEPTVLSEIP